MIFIIWNTHEQPDLKPNMILFFVDKSVHLFQHTGNPDTSQHYHLPY